MEEGLLWSTSTTRTLDGEGTGERETLLPTCPVILVIDSHGFVPPGSQRARQPVRQQIQASLLGRV